jgi:tellurite resistance protein TehA-like permease
MLPDSKTGKEKKIFFPILGIFIYLFYFIIHMCIQGLGHFFPLSPPPPLPTHSAPSLSSLPPQYPAETILPLFLILLKREYKP